MPINTSQRIEFLKNIHLFHSLEEEELLEIASNLEENEYASGQVILRQGAYGDRFFLIYSGKVKVLQERGRKEKTLAILDGEDYFGEIALLSRRRRTASVIAIEHVVLLSLNNNQLNFLFRKIRYLRRNFLVNVNSIRLAHQVNFKWLDRGEKIHFLAIKHPLILWRAVINRSLFIIYFMLFLSYFIVEGNMALAVLFGVLLLGMVLWLIWYRLVWGNNYYVVTNQRVIHLAKVFGYSESRHEAPLRTVLSVGVETSLDGRIWGYGNIVIRTYTGVIVFPLVAYPEQAAALIQEYWKRSKETSRRSQQADMEEVVRRHLGYAPKNPTLLKKSETPLPNAETPLKKRRTLPNPFQTRLEEGSKVTFRKHWYILMQRTFKSSLILAALFIIFVIVIVIETKIGFLSMTIMIGNIKIGLLLIAIAMTTILWLLFSGWAGWDWIYNYWDWQNDVYQITAEQIVDIERKPFGDEVRKDAALENILTTQYKREGLAAILLNFGTVEITVGGTKFNFYDVPKPSEVQQEIVQRMNLRIAQKNQGTVTAEGERIAEWMATYHRTIEEFQRKEDSNKNSK